MTNQIKGHEEYVGDPYTDLLAPNEEQAVTRKQVILKKVDTTLDRYEANKKRVLSACILLGTIAGFLYALNS